MVLSQVNCVVHVEVAGFQILLNGYHPSIIVIIIVVAVSFKSRFLHFVVTVSMNDGGSLCKRGGWNFFWFSLEKSLQTEHWSNCVFKVCPCYFLVLVLTKWLYKFTFHFAVNLVSILLMFVLFLYSRLMYGRHFEHLCKTVVLHIFTIRHMVKIWNCFGLRFYQLF